MSTPFLSRVRLALNVTRGFNATYITHQLVSDLFGDRDDRGFLYRETTVGDRRVNVLVLSDTRPDTSPASRDWGQVVRVETRPYDVTFTLGQRLDYEVRINATQVKTRASGKKQRLDVWDAEFEDDPGPEIAKADIYRAYLARKLEDSADIESCHVMERSFRKAARHGRRAIPFVATNLVGTLTVTDPVSFVETIQHGVGRSKAFGCGLICLSRPGTILPRRHLSR